MKRKFRTDIREVKNPPPPEKIGDYVSGIRGHIAAGVASPYPYDKEKLLLCAIRSGDSAEARRLLNEILGCIFFACAYDENSIKLRSFELIVLMSRAALDGGAVESDICRMDPDGISSFFAQDSLDDICVTLTRMLNGFIDATFGAAKTKHAAVISKTVSFVRENYMHKISLSDAAALVCLSPSHLGRIFREEMNCGFCDFLNRVRVDKSKMLLLSGDMSIAEISRLVGFTDQSYFNKVFRKSEGMTPNKFREKGGENDG